MSDDLIAWLRMPGRDDVHRQAAARIEQLESQLADATGVRPCCEEWEGCERRCIPRALHWKEAAERMRKAAPLCDEHQPNGGTRSGCLVCGLIRLSAALSRVDYACGEPNDMQCSDYDVHCNEDAVVERVERMRKALGAMSKQDYARYPHDTIESAWENFVVKDMAPEAPLIQRQEMHRAFIAGAASGISLMLNANHDGDMMAGVAKFHAELRTWLTLSNARKPPQ